MDGIKSDPQRQSVAVPFRILPSTGPRPLRLLVLGGLLIIGCGGLAIEIGIVSGALPPIGNWGSVSWRTTYNGQPSADGAWVMIAILENNQQPDGTVRVPPVLAPWMGGIDVIKPEK